MTYDQQSKSLSSIAIVGAGISGLATGLAILDIAKQKGLREPNIQILESEPHVGGKIQTIKAEGFTCEWGVNGFLNKEPKTIELAERIGLKNQLLPASAAFNKRYIYANKKLNVVEMHPLRFMASPLLPWQGKMRLLWEPFVRSKTDDTDESVADFARRRIGPIAFRLLVDPMQMGIYAGDPEKMSVQSCFPRVVEVEKEYGSLIKGMMKLARKRKGELPGAGPSGHLTSFVGGMQTLVDTIAAKLENRVRCNIEVTKIQRAQNKYIIETNNSEHPISADAVVLACPAYAAAKILSNLSSDFDQLLNEIEYSPLAVVCLGYKKQDVEHSLDGFGFLVPRNEGLKTLGALWTSSIFPTRVLENHVLMRVMIGGARDANVLEMDDEQLISHVCRELNPVLKILQPPTFTRVFRHTKAIPQYTLGHKNRLEQIAHNLAIFPNLHLTGNAYKGIGVNDCVKQSFSIANQVLASLSNPC